MLRGVLKKSVSIYAIKPPKLQKYCFNESILDVKNCCSHSPNCSSSENTGANSSSIESIALREALEEAVEGCIKNSVVRVNISGTIPKIEYEDRNKIYKEMLGQYLDYEVNDHELSEEITLDTIRAEFAETSFAAQFMEQLINDPVELQMAYTMLHECMEG